MTTIIDLAGWLLNAAHILLLTFGLVAWLIFGCFFFTAIIQRQRIAWGRPSSRWQLAVPAFCASYALVYWALRGFP